MTEINRKKNTGEPGNPGQFGSKPHSEADTSLTDLPWQRTSYTEVEFDTARESVNEALLFAARNPDDGEPLEAGYTIGDFAPETESDLDEDFSDFLRDAKPDIDELKSLGYGPDEVGRAYALNRVGAGGGFVEDKVGETSVRVRELLDRLDESASEQSAVDVYVGDDGLLYAD